MVELAAQCLPGWRPVDYGGVDGMTVVQQVVGRAPWGRNILLLTRWNNLETRLVYAQPPLPQRGVMR